MGKEELFDAFLVIVLVISIFLAMDNCVGCYNNKEDRKVQRCQFTADQQTAYKCLRYSVYHDLDSCSCVIEGTNDRVTFPNNWEE